MKAYKVVSIDRCSCIMRAPAYVLHYPKGEIVEAPKDSFGIMCFETLKLAQGFKIQADFLLLEVEGLGTPFRPPVVYFCIYSNYEVRNFYRRISQRMTTPNPRNSPNYEYPPPGTICFPKVKVLT